MMDELVETFHPVTAYRDNFAAGHNERAHQLFQTMVQDAGIDVEQNQLLNLRIADVSAELATRTKALSQLRTKRVLVILGAVATVFLPFIVNAMVVAQGLVLLPIGWVLSSLGAAGLAALTIRGVVQFTRQIRPAREQVSADTVRRTGYVTEASIGLAPLAKTYQWNMLDSLTEQTIPGLKLDPYVPSYRQHDLMANYGLAQPIGIDSSVVATQSGTFYDNPFVILQTNNFAMGSKTYSGTLVISWVETEHYTDSNGRSRTRLVTRTQTLVAQVDKPFPTYWPDALVIFGTEATPELFFSRGPSKLSALEGKRAERGVNRTVKKLEKQARKTTDGNNFTVTANQDFDALFHAANRNDETQFRVLFTPAAQQQMVELMRDKQFGFGDNFEFYKDGPVITVRPHHLIDTDLVGVPVAAPGTNEEWDLSAQRAGFTGRAAAQFRNLFYALAPIFAIPLLHEPRANAEVSAVQLPSTWEAEANANHRQLEFSHPESVTGEILKAQPIPGDPNQFQVTSSGFRGVDRMDFVPTLGGDGRIHLVPVPWVEYQMVERTRTMHLWDAAATATTAAAVPHHPEVHRRGLNSTITN